MLYSAAILSLLVTLSVAAPNPPHLDRGTLDGICKPVGRAGQKLPDVCAGNVTYIAKPDPVAFTNWSTVAFPKPQDCNAASSSAVERACNELITFPNVPLDRGVWHWFKWYGCTAGFMIPRGASGTAISKERCMEQVFQPMIDYAMHDGNSPHASYSINLLTHPRKNRVQGTVLAPKKIAFMVTGAAQTCDRCS